MPSANIYGREMRNFFKAVISQELPEEKGQLPHMGSVERKKYSSTPAAMSLRRPTVGSHLEDAGMGFKHSDSVGFSGKLATISSFVEEP